MKIKKFIEKTKEGEFEIIKNHVKEIDDLDEEIIKDIVDFCSLDDDYENAFLRYGVVFDFDYDIAFIEAGKFIESVRDFLKDNDDEEMIEKYEPTLKVMEKYKEYDIHLED